MAFPNTLRKSMIAGIPGELAFDGPQRGGVAVINTTTEANNVFGRVLTYRDAAIESVQAGGAGFFAGVLQHPKAWISDGDFVANGTAVEFLTEGEIYVTLKATGVIGAQIYFVPATGEITALATSNTIIPGAYISRHTPSTETPILAVVYIPGTLPTPAA